MMMNDDHDHVLRWPSEVAGVKDIDRQVESGETIDHDLDLLMRMRILVLGDADDILTFVQHH